LDELRRRVRLEHGPGARIVAAERIVEGGIGGFFARQRFEATVEVPDAPRGEPVVFDLLARAGIAALLAEAEEADDLVAACPAVGVSTASESFDRVLDDVVVATAPRGRHASVPRPLGAAGDLVVLVGLGQDAVAVAEVMATHVDAVVAVAGAAQGDSRVEERHAALAARADGVRSGRATIVAVGHDGGTEPWQLVRALAADQIWAVVDAGRKPEDTADWVAQLRRAIEVDALAVVGVALTGTPETVNELGLPVGWVDGGPSAARTL